MKVPAFFEGPQTLKLSNIIATINNGGTALTSVEEIVGYYAFDAATDGLDDWSFSTISFSDLEAHIDSLQAYGANIEPGVYSLALDIAIAHLNDAISDINSDSAIC